MNDDPHSNITFLKKLVDKSLLLANIGNKTLDTFKNVVITDLDERLDFISNTIEEEVDPFGMDPAELRKTAIFAAFLYKYYFRCVSVGINNIPQGPVILAANHGGQLPIDAVMITSALMLEANPPRLARSLMDRWVPSLPFVGDWFNSVGVTLGTPENAQRLLKESAAILVFPEGVAGISKTLDMAYKLQNFGLGFMRISLSCKAPIVPVSVVGSEEQYPTLYQLDKIRNMFHLPSAPIWAQMVIPLIGLLPLPVKYRLYFDKPMTFKGDPDDDDDIIENLVDKVKQKINDNIKDMRDSRRSVFL